MRPEVRLLVGMPGCGKTTWIKSFLASEEAQGRTWAIISSDNIIERDAIKAGLTYDEQMLIADKARTKALIILDIEQAVYHGHSIIWDQTNLKLSDRTENLSRVPERYRRIAVWFDVDPEVARIRRGQRIGKNIPEDILVDMKNGFTAPSLDQFDEIRRITD